MSSRDDDKQFVADLHPLWTRFPEARQRQLARRWLRRGVGDLLVEICRRQGLEAEAGRVAALPRLESIETARAISRRLDALADAIYEEERVPKSAHVAAMIWATCTAVDAYREDLSDDRALLLVCLRLRQLARAARRLEAESNRMMIDLADA